MTDPLVIWTYDWVPPPPRGHVRDIRLRWACEEAGLPYTIRAVRFEDRTEPDHLSRQPFAQVPALQDEEVPLFESGACLLHLGEKSEILMPKDAKLRGGDPGMGDRRAELDRDGQRSPGGSSVCPSRRKTRSKAGSSPASRALRPSLRSATSLPPTASPWPTF